METFLTTFGPVPSGGSPTLPGFILLAVRLLGFLSLSTQIRKMEPTKSQRLKLGFVVAVELGFVISGVVMVSHGLGR
jgi:FtsH-binding integral membrane protein